ncbi:hypothetical protein SAY87_009675 [Trapa incisa]|uniref:E3 ubiquitin protein ligase n=1 Tax=Trapa incisa TaxID=236973 RepID=A0AAN7K235_9MYRT|nr:hypothetical protein SAY87_009675 [Trapa incisa]
MSEETQSSSDNGSNRPRYEEPRPRHPPSPDSVSAPPPPADRAAPPPEDVLAQLQNAKQRTREIASRLIFSASAGASSGSGLGEFDGKSPSVDNGVRLDSPDRDAKTLLNTSSSAIPVSYNDFGRSTSKRIEIPIDRIGFIAGKDGETIKFLQNQSGAKIQVICDADADSRTRTRTVELKGTAEHVGKAEQIIKEVLAEAEAGGSGLVSRRDEQSMSPYEYEVNATFLLYHNQRLVQQLKTQNDNLNLLNVKIQAMRDNQASYDALLINLNQKWNQVIDDLIFLEMRIGGFQNVLKEMDGANSSRGSIPSSSPEEIFLSRLLEADSIASREGSGTAGFIDEALANRCAYTEKLMKLVENAITSERLRTDSIARSLSVQVNIEDATEMLSKIDDMMEEEAKNLREASEIIHRRHKEYSDKIHPYARNHEEDQSEIIRLKGELDESMGKLNEIRRKLISLKMLKDAASGISSPTLGAINGSSSPEKPAEKTARLRELKDLIEETKIVGADRLSELIDAREYNTILSEQLQDIQSELKDDKYLIQSRMYALLNDQLQHANAEVGRYRALTDALQGERSFVIRREKELNAKIELADVARNAIDNVDTRISDLELQLQKSISEKNDLEIKMEEALQDLGKKDIKAEFRVMASALSKEMGMMEMQLTRWKDIASEALSLREEAKALRASLASKSDERKSLVEVSAKQTEEIKCLKLLMERLQKENMELQIFLDMYGDESGEGRDVTEIRESERRANSQADVLRNALEEHNLELRVRAAHEAEAACQVRLSAAEAEIADLRDKLDSSEREVSELVEAIKMKDAEAETYISEMETIGQAYEDMQMQNQHLLQQMTERDDYNIKLVSDSVKTKQAQNSLLSEKQMLTMQLQQLNTMIESLKSKIVHNEEQMKLVLSEGMRTSQEERHLTASLEAAKWELADAEKELKWLKSASSSTEKEYDQLRRDMNEVQMELEKEREERIRLDEELAEWNRKLAKLTAETGEAAIQRLQDEINECKSVLKCSVCLDRPKQVVIVKCFHLFCNQCIQKNIEIRHRKCPACGTAFGQNDVRAVKI